MKGRIGMMVVAASLVWLGSCGSDSGSNDNPTREDGENTEPETAMCPAERPMDGEACTERSMVCEYDGGDCTCGRDSMGTFGALAWDCPRDFMAQMCPAQAPEPGSACMVMFGECPYGADKICDCADNTETWSCWNPADCPMTPPENMSACDTVGMECEYDDTMMDCDCTAEGWDCDMNPF